MSSQIAMLLEQLDADSWRREIGFSSDIEETQNGLFKSGICEAEQVELLRRWLERNQPCIFGRIAAKLDLISFCILSEEDLNQSDEYIHTKIQNSRLSWTKDGYEGRKSAFVILALSPKLAYAEPNKAVKDIAKHLCFLYLEQEIKFDTVHLDQMWLEKPGSDRKTWRFYTGVNYFSTHGDKRWWHDHRIPGGIAFSVNSVAHLAKSGNIAKNIELIKKEFEFTLGEGWIKSPVDSLEKALELAMRTISMAAETESGKATELITLTPELKEILPKCPVELPRDLANKNHCQYHGYYHTDFTLPSEYFVSDVVRPTNITPFNLDFTYLFHKDISNPDHFTMGEGKRIRAEGLEIKTHVISATGNNASRDYRGLIETVSVSEYESWLQGLEQY